MAVMAGMIVTLGLLVNGSAMVGFQLISLKEKQCGFNNKRKKSGANSIPAFLMPEYKLLFEPLFDFKIPDFNSGYENAYQNDNSISVFRIKFRHVGKIHAIPSCNQS